MNTMKAVRLFEFGGPDKLRYGDHPMPDVGPTDVLVKVLATSVSRWDVKYRTGEVHEFYGKSTGHHGGIHGRRAFPMPMQLGRDIAGEVAAVGAGVTTLAPGDRVLGMTNPENTLSLASIRGATRNDQRVVAELLEKGRIRMPIHAVLPLAKAAEAHAMLEHSEDLVGRIVLHPWDEV